MPSLRSGRKTFARAVSKKRVAHTASSRSQTDEECDNITSPKTMNNRTSTSNSEMAEAIDKPNNIDEATSDETGTCSTGLNSASVIAQNVQADGEGGTDRSPVDNQEASEITAQYAQLGDIGDKSTSLDSDPGALDSSEANKYTATTQAEASEGSDSSTTPNTPPAEHAPIVVNETAFMISCESISNAAYEPQTLAHDFTRAFDNTTGVPTCHSRESAQTLLRQSTPLSTLSHTQVRGARSEKAPTQILLKEKIRQDQVKVSTLAYMHSPY